jgi:hypothetical protein
MRKLFFLSAMILAACAKPSDNSQSVTPQVQRETKVIEINSISCLEIGQSLDSLDYMIESSQGVFIIQSRKLFYLNDHNQISRYELDDGELVIESCRFVVLNGLVASTSAPSAPSCGGMFQPACPLPVPVPCGPAGQYCYYH